MPTVYKYANMPLFFSMDNFGCKKRWKQLVEENTHPLFQEEIGWKDNQNKFFLEEGLFINKLEYECKGSVYVHINENEPLIDAVNRLGFFQKKEIHVLGKSYNVQKTRLLNCSIESWEKFCEHEEVLWHCFNGKFTMFSLRSCSFEPGKFYKSEHKSNRRCPVNPNTYVLDEYKFCSEDFVNHEHFSLFQPITVQCDGDDKHGIVYGTVNEWYGDCISSISVFVLSLQNT